VAKAQRQDGTPRAPKQKIRQTVMCTHSENNCTQDENTSRVRLNLLILFYYGFGADA
jgi:hypothetical protein